VKQNSLPQAVMLPQADKLPQRNLLFRLAYLGTPFAGWQRQKNLPSVQGLLEATIERITGEPSRVIGAGRTDRGVHALGQACNVHTSARISTPSLQRALNALLPPTVRIWQVEEVSSIFHARRDALGKAYLLMLWTDPLMNPFFLGRITHQPGACDWDRVRRALPFLLGKHDFRAFAKAGSTKGGTVRQIRRAELIGEPPLVAFFFWGTGFLQHMIRALAGTLLMIGQGRRDEESLQPLLAGADRSGAGPTLAADGLYLLAVHYTEEEIATAFSSSNPFFFSSVFPLLLP
jgi:tRNA pseudouridine38-40 synthase